MKRFLLVLFIFAMTFTAFAQDAGYYQPGQIKPSKSEVIVVMKINVNIAIDRDFIATTRGVSDSTKNDTFVVSSNANRSQVCTFDKSNNAIFVLKKDNSSIAEMRYAEYNFFGDKKANIFIPLGFSFKIPSDTKAVYLGTFNITVNKDYEITGFKRIDEYDIAQKELDEASALYKNPHYDLVRIEDLYVNDSK